MKNGPATIGGPVFNTGERLYNTGDRRCNYAAASVEAERTAELAGGAVSTKRAGA